MKTKLTNFSFLVKIVLLGSLILIGKFTGKSTYPMNSLKTSNHIVSDTNRFSPVYQQIIFNEMALKIKN